MQDLIKISFLQIGLISLLGNGLAVQVFRKRGPEINVPEVLLLNIAAVDLFLGMASYPATIVAAFSHRWVFGEAGKVYFYNTKLFNLMYTTTPT